MPSNAEAIAYFHKNGVEFGAAKAANAGGVAVSGLEMAQNSARLSWSREEVDDKLKVCLPLSITCSNALPLLFTACCPVEVYCAHDGRASFSF